MSIYSSTEYQSHRSYRLNNSLLLLYYERFRSNTFFLIANFSFSLNRFFKIYKTGTAEIKGHDLGFNLDFFIGKDSKH